MELHLLRFFACVFDAIGMGALSARGCFSVSFQQLERAGFIALLRGCIVLLLC